MKAREHYENTILAFGTLVAMAFAAIILVHFHDRTWVPRDEGYIADIASRLLSGAVLHRDVQGLHTGYGYFVNAGALWLFGDRLVSMRYPLVALGIVQAGLMFLLFIPRGMLVAAAAALLATALGYVQFLTPSVHWYCLFLVISIIAALRWMKPETPLRLETLGFLMMTLIGFRQLTGILVAAGVLSYLLIERPSVENLRSRFAARGLILIVGAGLLGYVALKSEPVATILFGIFPLALLTAAWFAVGVSNLGTGKLIARLALGATVGALPLVVYHTLNGSLTDWYLDAVVGAVAMSDMDYVKRTSYGNYILFSLSQILALQSFRGVANGLFWLLVMFAPGAVGVFAFHRILRSGEAGRAVGPLVFLAPFYGMVALHYQDPTYLLFTTLLSTTGLLWLTVGAGGWRLHTPVLVASLFAAAALVYHAGQPISRGELGILSGERVALQPMDNIARLGLRLDAPDVADYTYMLRLIDRDVPPGESMLAVPGNSELYFLSNRRNPLPFAYLPYGIRTDADVDSALAALQDDPPALVFYVPSLPYNTPETERIMDVVRANYEPLDAPPSYEIYRRRRSGIAIDWTRTSGVER